MMLQIQVLADRISERGACDGRAFLICILMDKRCFDDNDDNGDFDTDYEDSTYLHMNILCSVIVTKRKHIEALPFSRAWNTAVASSQLRGFEAINWDLCRLCEVEVNKGESGLERIWEPFSLEILA